MILADRILAGRILAGRILAGRILADRILADRILAGRILADMILADRILADRILADMNLAANNSLRKSLLSERRNGSDPSRLQSYLAKGLQSCPSGFVVRLVCMDPECGTRPAYYRSPLRIMGGDDVKPGTYPWMVSLHGGRNQVFFCGATIIHEQWVMTAGHCVGEG
ncbi:chymotrypsinogen B [Biomphalaria glabrata]|nr:chymotrypsinogen B [Biomphalaria glabrata]